MQTLIAQITSVDVFAPLLQVGVPGVVLGWFMLRSEARFRGMERAVNRMSKSVLLLVVSIDSSNSAMKEQAKLLMREIESTEKERVPGD